MKQYLRAGLVSLPLTSLLLLSPGPAWTQTNAGTVSVEFLGGSYSGLREPEAGLAIEGNWLVFRLSRTGTDTRRASGKLEFTRLNGQTADYTVDIPAGSSSQTFKIRTDEDSTVQRSARTFTVSISSVLIRSTAILEGAPVTLATYDVSETAGSVTVDVMDDDVRVSARLLDPSKTAYVEGSTATVAVVLTRNGDKSLALPVTLDSNSTRAEDWSGSFAANSSTVTANVTLNDDSTYYDDETVTLTVYENPVEGRRAYRRGTPGSVEFTVTEDDKPAVRASVRSGGESVQEGSPARFVVSREGSTTEDLVVAVEVTSGLSQFVPDAPSSWTRTLTIASGEESVAVEVPTEDDDYDDADGFITLTVTPKDHYRVSTAGTNQVQVLDGDLPFVSIWTSQPHVAEDGHLAYTLTRSSTDPAQVLTVKATLRWTGFDESGSFGSLANAFPQTSTVRFPAGVTEVTGRIKIRDDDKFNVRTSTVIFLDQLPGNPFRSNPQPEVHVPIDDDDPVHVEVEAVTASIRESEVCAEFRIRFDNIVAVKSAGGWRALPGARRIVVPLAVTVDGNILSGVAPTELALPSGAHPGSHRTVCVSIDDDGIYEPAGSVTLTLQETGDDRPADHAVIRHRQGGNASARVDVLDDDLPRLTLVPAQESVEEGSSAIFVLTREEGDIESALEAEISIVQNPGNHYPRTLDVTFPEGESAVRFAVPVPEDPARPFLPSHHLRVAATKLNGTPYPGEAVRLPVVDRNPVRVSFLGTSSPVSESGGPLSFGVYLVGTDQGFDLPDEYQGWRDREVTLEVSVSQVGDFLAAGAVRRHTITLTDQSRTARITVPLDDDAVAEPDGQVSARIIANDSIALHPPGLVTVEVTDDDEYDSGAPAPGAPIVGISAASDEVTEGQDVMLTVSRGSAGVDKPLTVYLNIGGHPKIMSAKTRRLAANSGATPDVGITVPAGSLLATLTLTTEDDRLNEGDGELIATLAANADYNIDADRSRARVLVRDDDIPEVSIEWIEPAFTEEGGTYRGSMVEGGDLRYRFVCTDGIERDNGSVFPVISHVEELNHPVHGYNKDLVQTGICNRNMASVPRAGQRYVGPANGTISLRLLEATDPWTVGFLEDFVLCREPYCPKYRIGSPNRVEIEVLNRNPTVVVAAAADAIEEGETARFTLRRIWNSENLADGYTTRVRFRVTDAAGYALGTTPTEATFGAGVTTLTVEIPTEDDTVTEEAGDLVLELLPDDANSGNIGGSYEIYDRLPGITPPGKSSKRASVRVVSNDRGPGVTFNPPALTMPEGGSAQYTLSLNTDPSQSITVGITALMTYPTFGFARDRLTVSPPAPVIEASAWQTPVTFTVTAADDDDGDNGQFQISHDLRPYLSGGRFLTVTVIDDEAVSNAVALDVVPSSVAEGDTVTATVTGTLNGSPRAEATVVTVSVAGVTATAGDDFVAVPDSALTIAAGETAGTASFQLVTTEDHRVEGDETLSVTGTATGGLTVTAASFTLRDDDVRGVVVEPRAVYLVEGYPGRYRVRLATPPTGSVTVTAALSSGAEDFLTLAPAALTFTPETWSESQPVTLTSMEDSDAEDEEATISLAVSGADYQTVTVPPIPVYVLDPDPESMAVVLSAVPATVSEAVGSAGRDIAVTAMLDGATLAEDVVVTVSVAGGTAAVNADFQAVSDFTLTVPAHGTSAAGTFRLSLVDDRIAEGDETLTLTGAVSGVSGLEARSATLTIADDDERGVSVRPDLVVVHEGGAATYTVALLSRPTGSVTVTPVVSGDADVAVSDAVVFSTSDWSAKTLTVTASEDTDLDNDEATISHTVAGADYQGVTAADVAVSVTDDDQDPVTIAAADGEVREGGTVRFIVTRGDPAASLDVTVRVSENGRMLGSGQSGARTVSFAAGATAETIEVTTENDRTIEPPSAVTAAVAYGDGYKIGVPGSASVLVADDDQILRFSLVLPIGPVDESAGTLPVPVTVTTETNVQPSHRVTVLLSSSASQVPGTFTARTGRDLVPVSEHLRFNPEDFEMVQIEGQTRYRAQVYFNVTILDDEIDEDEETFPLSLGPVPGFLGTYGVRTATVTITDDDATPVVSDARAFEVEENQTPVATLSATDVDHDDGGLEWSISGGADAARFTLTSGGELSFKAGQDYENPDDADGDGVYEVTVKASDGTNEATAAVTVTLVDVVPSVTVATVTESVGEGADVEFSLTRTGDLSGAQTVSVTVAEEADTSMIESSSEGDRQVVFADGAAAVGLTVATVDDEVDEPHATVTVTVTSGTGYEVGATGPATATVRDDDDAGVQVEPRDLLVAEGLSDTYRVVLTSQPEGSVTVTPEVPTGTDVTVSPLQLTFGTRNWSTARTVRVTADDDPDGITDEAVEVTHAVSGYGTVVEAAAVTVAIDENDQEALIVSPTDLVLNEGESITYTVALATEPAGEATVAPRVILRGGVSLSDVGLTLRPEALTFTTRNWSTAQTITLAAAHDDDAVDPPRGYPRFDQVGYSGPQDWMTLTVKDDDTTALVFSKPSLALLEGDSVDYTVALAAQPTGTETVTVTVSGADGTDLTLEREALTFTRAMWDVRQTVKVTAAHDIDMAAEEKVTLTHTAAGGDYDSVTGSVGVTVTDDDDPGLVVSPPELTVTEGDAAGASYTVRLAAQPTAAVTVGMGTDLSGTDLAVNKVRLTFTTTDWAAAQTVTVTAAEDNDAVVDDAVTLSHTAGGGGYGGVTAATTVSIAENDEPPVTITAGPSVSEGETATFMITRSDGAAAALDVTVGVSEDEDMLGRGQAGRRTVTFEAGTSTVTIEVSTRDDTRHEPSSEVTVTVEDGRGYDVGMPGSASVRVSDDDLILEYSLVLPIGPVDENAGTLRVELTATTPGGEEPRHVFGIALSSQDPDATPTHTALAPGDLEPVSERIFFQADTFTAVEVDGERRYRAVRHFDVEIVDDDIDEEEETFILVLGPVPGLLATYGVRKTTVTITDDDATPVVSDTRAFEVEENRTVVATLAAVDADHDAIDLRWSIPAGADGGRFTLTIGGELSFKAGKDYENPDDADGDGAYEVTVKVSDGTNESTAAVTVTLVDVAPSVTIAAVAESVEEGEDLEFTLTRAGDLSGAQTVSVTVAEEGTGSMIESSAAGDRQVVFAADLATVGLTVATVDDEVDEPNGVVKVTVKSGTGYEIGATETATVSVRDNDEAGLVVGPGELLVPEGSSGTYTVTLATEPTDTVTVTMGTDLTRTDLEVSPSPATLTFTATTWKTAQTVTVTAKEDDDAVADAAVTLNHTASGGDYGTATGSVKVTIVENDAPGLLVNPGALTVPEGAGGIYTVRLATEPTDTVTVTMGTELTGTDLSVLPSPVTLTFTATTWETAQTVTVTAREDEDAVADAAVTLSHTAAGGDYGSATGSVTVTIAEDDEAAPSLGLTLGAPVHNDVDGSGDVTLGDELSYTATATNTGNVPLTEVEVADVRVSPSGTECATLAIGGKCELSGSYEVSQADVDLGKVVNTATAEAAELTDEVTDEVTAEVETEVAQKRGLGLEKTAVTGSFGTVGDELSYEYEVTNSGTVTLTGTVAIEDDKIAASGIECGAVPEGGLEPGGTVSCTGTYTVTQADVDASGVTNEATATLGGVISSSDTARASWRQAQDGTDPVLAVGAAEFGEGDGAGVVAVSLSAASVQTVEVTYATADGTAKAGEDYTEASGRLTFAPSERRQTIRVALTDDSVDEGNETFTVTLSEASNAGLGSASATYTIVDDDTVGLVVDPEALPVTEGAEAGASYTVALATEPTGTVTVTMGTDLTGTELSVDKTSLTFTATTWETAQTVTVKAREDDDAVADAAVTLSHTASGGDYGTVTGSVTVTIVEKDTPGLELEPAELVVGEGSSGTYAVALATEPTDTVTVTMGTVLTGTELSVDKASLTFTARTWETAQTVTVTAKEDHDAVADAKVTLNHTASGGDYGTATGSVKVTIVENDAPGLLVNPGALTVPEGAGGIYTVRLATEPTDTVTVTMGTELTGTDLSVLPSPVTLTFTATTWETAQTVTVTAREDEDAVADAAVTLSHTASGGDYGSATGTVTVTIVEKDAPGLVLEPEALTVTEADAVGESYTVRLATEPTDTVTVTMETDLTETDVKVSSKTLTFTATTWETKRTVTVTADEDEDAVVDAKVTLSHTASGGDYGSATGSVTVTIVEKDAPGLVLEPEALTVTEADAVGESYTVRLATEPTDTVTVTMETDLTETDVKVSSKTLTFTATTWETKRTVTVTADEDEDAVVDAKVTLSHTASGGDYGSATGSVTVTIVEKDAPGLVLEPEALTVTEADAVGESYTVRLATEPTDTVTVTMGTDLTETDVKVSSKTLTFTATTWETKRTVTVTADEDDDAVADAKVTLSHTASGGDYGSATGSVTVTIVEKDAPGLVLEPEALTVTEADAVGESYTVRLATEPTGSVTVTMGTDLRGTDLEVTPKTLTFTATTWGTKRTVTVTADEDDDAVADAKVTLSHTASGGDYGSATGSVTVTIVEKDAPGLVLEPEALTVTEADAVGESYTVRLATEPTDTVTVTMGTDLTETDVKVSSKTLTFTATTWETKRTVTVTADEDDDAVADAKVTLSHTASGGDYGSATGSVTVTIVEKDAPGLVLEPEALTVTEADAVGESYTVRLATEPTASVTVTMGTDLRGTDLEVTPKTLTFTATTWGTKRTVMVTADEDDDAVTDAKVTLSHTASGGDYGSATGTVTVTIVEKDAPGLVLEPEALTVTEADAVGESYTVRLAREPTGTVTVTMETDLTETDVKVSSKTLTFTATTWETKRTVTVTADEDDDAVTDAKVTLSHTAAGGDYGSVTGMVTVTIVEKDAPGLALEPEALTVTEADAVGESYTVRLATEPTDTVTVTMETDLTETDVKVSSKTLTFTATTWETAQTVTVTADKDEDAVADAKVTLSHTAAGGDYGSVTGSVTVTIVETDTEVITIPDEDLGEKGLVLLPARLTVEEGSSVSYRVALATEPTDTVTVTMTTDLTGTDLSVNKTSLTFSTTAWETAQTVTVIAAEDEDPAADREVTLSHAASGGGYGSVTGSVTVTIVNNDTELITILDEDQGEKGLVLQPTRLRVGEGNSASYRVALATEPSDSVTVTLTGTSRTDLSVRSGANLTFSTTNWGAAQTVTLRAGEDADSWNDTATLTHTAAGGDYEGVTRDLSVTVVDDDTAALVLSTRRLRMAEGGQAIYTVRLKTRPSQRVTVKVKVSGTTGTGLTLSKRRLTFSTADWRRRQTITVEAGTDANAWDDTATLTHRAAGGDYDGVTRDLSVTVVDDDEPGVELTPVSVTVKEGRSASYRVALATEPSNSVTVALAGTRGTDLSVRSGASLTFSTTNWGTAQVVTLRAGEDADGWNDAERLTHTAAGGDYGGVTRHLSVTVVDDDELGVELTPASLRMGEGNSASYTVALATEPSDTVTMTLAGTSGTDLSVRSGASLTFSTANWGTAQTVTVSAGEDADGWNDAERLTHTAAGGDYGGVTGHLSVTVVDDDEPGVELTPASVTVEEGGSVSYTVALATKPSDPVTVMVAGTRGTDLSVRSGAGLTFSTANWGTAQTVTVSAGEDADGWNDAATLTHTAAGGDYGGVTGDLSVTVVDDDEPGVELTPASVTVEEEGSADYTVVLATQPSGAVTATPEVPEGTDVTVSPPALTFTTASWHESQTVTVTAARDLDALPDAPVGISHGVRGYGDVTSAGGVTVTIVEIDVTGIALALTATRSSYSRMGDELDLTYTVTNTGTVPLAGNVTVDDDRIPPDDIACAQVPADGLPAQGTTTCTAAYAVTQEDLDDGSFATTATAFLAGESSDEETLNVSFLDPHGPSPPRVSVQNSMVDEGAGVAELQVTLSRHSVQTVTVRCWVTEGSASSGVDYLAMDETMTIPPGSMNALVRVKIIDDTAIEPMETFTVNVDNPVNSELQDPRGTVSIMDDDGQRSPKPWLARFGRTAAQQAVQMLEERWKGAPESEMTVGGYGVGSKLGPEGTRAGSWGEATGRGTGAAGGIPGSDASVFRVGSGVLGLDAPGFGDPAGLANHRGIAARDLLMKSSFRLTQEAGPGQGRWTAWGRGMAARFDGKRDGSPFNGDVAGGMLGVDREWDGWLAGVALAHTLGEGEQAKNGSVAKLEATLTGLHPYVRLHASDRLSLWAVLGYGLGELTYVEEMRAARERTDIASGMAGMGARGVLAPAGAWGKGMELAARADALLSWIRSDAVGLELEAARAKTSRLRLILEGRRQVNLGSRGNLTSILELGVRYDGGDAERGTGLEMGGRLQYGYPAWGLALEAGVRGLLAHEDRGYREWGASGAVRLEPGSSGQGFRLKLEPSWGNGSKRADELWGRQSVSGLVPEGAEPAGRLTLEMGYGLKSGWSLGLLTPYAGLTLQDGGTRTQRVGMRWDPGTGFNASLEGIREEPGRSRPVDHGVRLDLKKTF